jgi:hypothetical protein
MDKVQIVLGGLSTLTKVQSKSFYVKLLDKLNKRERIAVYQACMNSSILAKHASKVQGTYFEGSKGGFEQNLGGNGAMG